MPYGDNSELVSPVGGIFPNTRRTSIAKHSTMPSQCMPGLRSACRGPAPGGSRASHRIAGGALALGRRPAILLEGRAVSSAGRAPRLHRGCRRFESVTAHHQPSGNDLDKVPMLAPLWPFLKEAAPMRLGGQFPLGFGRG